MKKTLLGTLAAALMSTMAYAGDVDDVSFRGIDGTVVVVDFTYTPNPQTCLLYTSPSPRDRTRSRMPSSA